jgi:hypothetical protein
MNFLYVGLISAMLPGASVVHCQRDPLETRFSCFCRLATYLPFASNLRSLGRVYRAYERLMDHWRSILPAPMREFRLESVVADPETEIRALVEAIGLPWEDACLAPERSGHIAVTASMDQVRSPISAKHVGRYEPYRPLLGELIEALGDGRR